MLPQFPTDLLHGGRKLQTQLDDCALGGRKVIGAGQRRPGRETATQQLSGAARRRKKLMWLASFLPCLTAFSPIRAASQGMVKLQPRGLLRTIKLNLAL